MKFRFTIIMLITALMCFSTLNAAQNVDVDRLESQISALKIYKYDQNNGVDLNWVEAQVAIASKDNQFRPKIEQKLLESLKATQSNDAKQFICRQLRTIGTKRSVPQLAALLTDKKLSHMAVYALGRMECAEAKAALHKALALTNGKIKAGIINALVQADYRAAYEDIARLVSDSNKTVSKASIQALGTFGGSTSVKKLQAAGNSASKDVMVVIDESILICAEKLLADGKDAEAISIYTNYYKPGQSGTPQNSRPHGFGQGLAELMRLPFLSKRSKETILRSAKTRSR